MAKKTYPVRFYKSHDKDLVTFIEKHNVNIIKAVYCALTSFCNGELFLITIPPEKEVTSPCKKKIYTRVLRLDEERDKKAIQLLARIKDGCRNNFLKNLLRLYLCYPLSSEFLVDREDINSMVKMFDIFRNEQRIADAASCQKQTKKKNNHVEPKDETRNINEKMNEPDAKNCELDLEIKAHFNDLSGNANNDNSNERNDEANIESNNEKQSSDDDELLDLFASLM